MKITLYKTALRLGIFLIACVMTMSVAAEKSSAKAGGRGTPVHVMEARQMELAPVVNYPATIISRHDACLPAEVDGRIEWMAEIGSAVKTGESIARLDSTLVKQEQIEAAAAVKSAEARLKFFKKEVKRLERLARQNNAAQRQLDQALSDESVTLEDLHGARARLKRLDVQLERMQVPAPYDGVVTERLRQIGEWADKGQDIVRFVSTQSLEIQTRIPANVLPYLQHDQQVQFESVGQTGTARLKQIVPVGDDRSRLYELRLVPESGKWFAGQTAQVGIPTALAKSVIAIPSDALILRREGIRVFRIKQDNSAEPVMVKTGIAAEGWIEVTGNIQAGDKVVTRGGERLRPGMAVSILPPQGQP